MIQMSGTVMDGLLSTLPACELNIYIYIYISQGSDKEIISSGHSVRLLIQLGCG